MATYYVTTAGNDANGGTNDTTDAWLTIDKGFNTVVAGDTLAVKAGTYAETATIDTAATAASPIRVIGYTSTLGDATTPVVTVDAAGVRASCISVTGGPTAYYKFANFRFTGSTDDGFNCPTINAVAFENCQADNNATGGFNCLANCALVNCTSFDNGGDGVAMGNNSILVGCSLYGNGATGATLGFGAVALCRFYGNATSQLVFTGSTQIKLVLGCTFVGTGSSANCIYGSNASLASPVIIVNNILYDAATYGINLANTLSNIAIARNNLFYSNGTADRLNIAAGTGDLTGSDPLFIDAGADDYNLSKTSPARNAGFAPNGAMLDIGCMHTLYPSHMLVVR